MKNKIEILKLNEVFIPVGEPNLTYIERPSLKRSIDAWKLLNSKHLIIFGPSKTGKTSLWKKHIGEENVIKIPTNKDLNPEKIYTEIFKTLQSTFIKETSKETSESLTISAKLKATLAQLLSLEMGASGTFTTKKTEKTEHLQPEINVRTITEILKEYKKIVLLEDFHYANQQTREIISQDLKAFSDDNIPWVFIGVQHKTSDILPYNTDLQQRISEVQVEDFNENELREIIQLGELALNIKFSDDLVELILPESLKSASLLQNICQRICIIMGIFETQENQVVINDLGVFSTACSDLARENLSNYQRVVSSFSKGGRSDGTTEKYKWILKMVRDKDFPDNGLKNTEVYKNIKDMGNDRIEQASVTSGLSYFKTMQDKYSFPTYFDYDEDIKTFYLLDKYLKFVLKWQPSLIDDLYQ